MDKNVKILHITKGEYGGLDNITKKIIYNFKNKYNQEILFFYDNGNQIYKEIKKQKVFSINFHGEIIFVNFFKTLNKLFFADIIHIHHTKTWILFSPLLIFYKKNIFSFHNAFGVSIKKSIIQNIIIKLIINYVSLFSKKIICLTDSQKENLLKYCLLKKSFNKKVLIINNFIDKKSIINEKKDFNNKVLFVGRYEKLKGFYNLLEVSKNIKDIDFCFIGGDKIRMKQENIINYGKIKNSQILEYYDKCSIFILPSYTEAFPMTILEAMSRGLVVLASDIPGMSEIIKDGRNGYLFYPEDIEKIKEIIKYLRDNPDEIKRISKNNLKDIKKFVEENLIKEYEKLYKKLIK